MNLRSIIDFILGACLVLWAPNSSVSQRNKELPDSVIKELRKPIPAPSDSTPAPADATVPAALKPVDQLPTDSVVIRIKSTVKKTDKVFDKALKAGPRINSKIEAVDSRLEKIQDLLIPTVPDSLAPMDITQPSYLPTSADSVKVDPDKVARPNWFQRKFKWFKRKK